MPLSSSSSAASADEGRFLPGTLLAERYRIIGRLGKGGMGEVYRATDIRLGQTVALKFLPEATATDPATLARFHSEVRIARQVTHPNVCRVYDLGEYLGQPFISMEYVDGEDLASLLRRIGRLPVDKATEIARRLCAGLAAAHSQGVLHRDLKPANIMIDGRGQVVITDFGLAGIENQVSGAEVRNGTPAYMAPEQLSGKEVSARSDIYSLGLVLYEIFSGKRAWEATSLPELLRLREESAPASLSTFVREIDPAVERVILRCLEPDPARRPASALAVSAALPGGDVLAAALAAGETPSPEMVAAGNAGEGVRPWVAVTCLAATVVVVAALVFFNSRQDLASAVKWELPPDALAFQAHNYIRQFGYTAPPEDSARGLTYLDDYVGYLYRHPGVRTEFANSRPSLILFWYRESPQALNDDTFPDPGEVTPGDPPMALSGMTLAMVDIAGRLVAFRAVPPEIDESAPLANPSDPAPLFAAAGLDLAAFSPAPPKWTPLALADERRAWTGAYPGKPPTPLRVEAAWWRGRPVYFNLVGPWTTPGRMPQADDDNLWERIWLAIKTLLIVAGAVLAWYNIRTGRGDRRGALRLGAFVFTVSLVRLLLQAHHTATAWESTLFFEILGAALWQGARLWLAYLALEPWVRRRWPRTMVTWARLLAGDVRDALLGRDLLIGILVGLGYGLVFVVAIALMQRRGAPPSTNAGLDGLLGLLPLGGGLLNRVTDSLGGALLIFLFLFLLRVVLRREWLAGGVLALLFALGKGFASGYPTILIPTYAMVYGLLVVVLLRFGLVAAVACLFVANIMINGVFTASFGAWYGTPSLVVCLCVIGLAAWAFRSSLAGRSVLEGVLGE
jgi:predicted Ser/Thr protein kinase